MSDTQTVATPADSVPRDGTSANIVKAIHDRASGRAPAAAQPPIKGQEPQQPPVNPSADEASKAGKEKYVVDGKEVWLTPEERTAWIQKGMAFEPRMDELARIKQEAIMLQRALLTNPGAVLANISKQNNVPMQDLVQRVLKGNSSDEIKEAVGKWYYEEAVEPLKMTDAEKKARDDARWRQEREQKDQMDKEMTIRRENYAKFQKAFGEIKANINEAMKESGLPSNDTPLGAEMARMVADVMRTAHFRRVTVTPKQAIEFVKKRVKEVQGAYYDHLDGEGLFNELGEKTANKLRAYFLKVAQGAGNPPPAVPNGQRPAARGGERKTWNMDDFHDYLDKRKQEG